MVRSPKRPEDQVAVARSSAEKLAQGVAYSFAPRLVSERFHQALSNSLDRIRFRLIARMCFSNTPPEVLPDMHSFMAQQRSNLNACVVLPIHRDYRRRLTSVLKEMRRCIRYIGFNEVRTLVLRDIEHVQFFLESAVGQAEAVMRSSKQRSIQPSAHTGDSPRFLA